MNKFYCYLMIDLLNWALNMNVFLEKMGDEFVNNVNKI